MEDKNWVKLPFVFHSFSKIELAKYSLNKYGKIVPKVTKCYENNHWNYSLSVTGEQELAIKILYFNNLLET